ncbi:PREDICTED: eukaryotic translation initiation factor 2-alpha kinase 1-like isoform X2 [Wasmannia auropunctata]|uniref:eukaryotic translation initiation factor 2-alpha kinase 1-like isoform X2 n=1 Tax=Wasmannia auropunctata TaxID=64793 RepID=UPI0005EE3462|nr:PREDICTED: eukaryotic translation initiation factor 2-alpha kinase 1-like isoform X2 [Wasmannia auropunctata]
MSNFTDPHVASLRSCSGRIASVRLVERCLDVVAETGFRERWNLGAVSSEPRQSALAWLGVMRHATRDSISSDREMTENTEQTNHPWSALVTVAAFDQGTGDNVRPISIYLTDIDENQSNGTIQPQEQQIAQSASVLIESLVQQLCTAMEQDKAKRKRLFYIVCNRLRQMNLINDNYYTTEYEILRGQYERAFCHMLKLAHIELGNENVLAMSLPRFIIPKLFRYHEEFHEICFIARGGFGKVYKAQHRLDGIEYAIKKITMPVDHMETIQTQLKEVRTLAKLNHTNIVSYNAAWIEPKFPSPSASTSPDRKSSHRSKYHQPVSKYNSQTIDDLFKSEKDTREKKICENTGDSSSAISIRFEEVNSLDNAIKERITEDSNIEESTDESSLDVISFQKSKNKSKSTDETITDTDTSSSYSCEESSSQKVCTYTSTENRPYVILYIQMALCEQTLEKWLHGKISATPEPMVRAIFQQIVSGVNYIHSQDIIHHDIKPSNIFISTSGQLQIQLGDFGLACLNHKITELQKEKRHNSVIGTHLYAAPEQLKGKCDQKSDIYSIGIVLIELLILIKTQMELCAIIRSLKNGNIPEVLIKRHKWTLVVMQLIQKDPGKRPSSSELLKNFDDDKDIVINSLKDTVLKLTDDNRDKDNTIQKLQEQITFLQSQLDCNNALLKEKVEKLSPDKSIN